MSKFNFFTPYLAKQEKGKTLFKRIVSIGLLVLILAGVASGFLFFRSSMIKGDIEAMQEMLQQPEMQKKKQEMEKFKNQMVLGKDFLKEMSVLEKNLDTIFVINVELIDKITSNLPSEVIFKGMKLSTNDLNISGVSSNWSAIAEFQYNLKKMGVYNNIHVDTINRDKNTAGYSFVLTGDYNGLGSDQDDVE